MRSVRRKVNVHWPNLVILVILFPIGTIPKSLILLPIKHEGNDNRAFTGGVFVIGFLFMEIIWNIYEHT